MAIKEIIKEMNPKKASKIIMLRHGSTKLNNKDRSEDRIRGWLDVSLNAEGIDDAVRAAKKLSKEYIDVIYSSDLKRALQTAKIINKKHKVPLIESFELRPWNLGIYHGQKSEDVANIMEDLIYHENKTPPEGEPFKDFRERFLEKLQELIKMARKRNEVVLIVTHYRNFKIACAWIEKGMPEDLSIDKKEMLLDNVNPGDTYEIPL